MSTVRTFRSFLVSGRNKASSIDVGHCPFQPREIIGLMSCCYDIHDTVFPLKDLLPSISKSRHNCSAAVPLMRDRTNAGQIIVGMAE